MPKIMKKYHYDRLILALFDALFYACRRKNTFVSLKHNIVLSDDVIKIKFL